jgi:hypothetical protein
VHYIAILVLTESFNILRLGIFDEVWFQQLPFEISIGFKLMILLNHEDVLHKII